MKRNRQRVNRAASTELRFCHDTTLCYWGRKRIAHVGECYNPNRWPSTSDYKSEKELHNG